MAIAVVSTGGVLFADARIDTFIDLGDKQAVELGATLPEGGKSEVEFITDHPEIRLKKWNGEVNLGVSYDKVQTRGQRPFLSNRMEWKDGKEEVHAYPLDAKAGMEDGGFEIEVFLKEKPDTNVFDFTIDGAENLDFFYQPALTQAEIDAGDVRPENVIGSYAIYYKDHANHIIGQTNYATGKAYHIYRPKAIDAEGNETWAVLDYQDGVLSVTVPQKFLDDAIYPVRVDPTFGYTSLGATQSTEYCGLLSTTKFSITVGMSYNLSEAGTLDSISIGTKSSGNTETVDMFAALYREDSAGPSSHDLVASVERLDVSVTTTATFYTFTAASESLTADDYVIAGLCDGADVAVDPTNIKSFYDSSSNHTFYATSESGAGAYATRKAENPWLLVEPSTLARTYSLYATYTSTASAPANSATVNVQGQVILEGQMIIQ